MSFIQLNKMNFLRVLESLGSVLHNNRSKSVIRGYAEKRQFIDNTNSDQWRQCYGIFAGFKKTCRTHEVSVW